MKMRKGIAFLLAALMMLSACGQSSETTPASSGAAQTSAAPQPSTAAEITVTDMIGREVKILPGSYKKVACIGAGALRMYSYVCDVNLLAGVEDIDNTSLAERPRMFDSVARPYILAYGDIFAKLPSCGVGGPNAQAAEAEKILSCAPDIVISEYEDADKENALQTQLGVPVITLRSGSDGVFGDAFTGSLRLLGQIFGKESADKAEKLAAFVEDQTKKLAERTASVKEEDKPAVYICGLGNWGTTNHLMTWQNYVPFQKAGIKNAVTDLEKNGVQAIEKEKLAALGANIDVMILDAAAVKNILPLYKEDPKLFDGIKAWENGEVYLQMAYNAYYTNYEIALINTWFNAKSVYPELFQDVDMTVLTNEITQAFLGKPLAEQIFACPSSFGGYQKIDTETFFK